jgi:hypothetical protein
VLEPPLADEGLAMLFDRFRRFRVDHFILNSGVGRLRRFGKSLIS